MPRTALIVVDMVNTYEFEDADRLGESVEATLPAMRGLIDRAAEEDALTVYVNDNFGRWRSNSDADAEVCEAGDCRLGASPART